MNTEIYNTRPEEILASVLQTHESVAMRKELQKLMTTVDNTVTAQTLKPNRLYVFTNRTADLTITLETPTNSGIVNEYHFIIEVGDTLPTITFPASVEWTVGPLELTPFTKVEISILNNSAIWV